MASRGDDVAMGILDRSDEALEAKSTQVVGHLRASVLVRGAPQQARNTGAQVGVAKAVGEMHVKAEGEQEGHDARLSESQAGNTRLCVMGGRQDDALWRACGPQPSVLSHQMTVTRAPSGRTCAEN